LLKLLFSMASQGSSSSDSGPSVDARIGALEDRITSVRARVERQERLQQATNEAGEAAWDLLNDDIRSLRTDHTEQMQVVREEVQTGLKDVENTQGDYGKRITTLETRLTALETAVAKLVSKLEK
jgi:RNA binding exosome subunit